MLLVNQALDDQAPALVYITLSDTNTLESPIFHRTSTTMSNTNDLPIDTPPIHILMYAQYSSEAEMRQAVDHLRNKKLRGIPQRYYLTSEPSFHEMKMFLDAIPDDEVCYVGKDDQGRKTEVVHLDTRSEKYVAWWIVKVDKATHIY